MGHPVTPVAIALGVVIGLGLTMAVIPRWRPQEPAVETTVETRTSSLSSAPHLSLRALAVLEDRLARAGWADLSAGAVASLWSVGSIAAGAVVSWLVPLAVLGPLTTVALVLAGSGVLKARVERRERILRAVWPGVVEHLRQAVRSGASVGEAVWSAGDMVPPELRPAFLRFRTHLEAGQSVAGALTRLKDDVANPVADRIIEALRMAHEVGGPELPRILADLHASVRADWQVREDALAKQAWIRSASKLGAAAPWIVLVMISGRPETQASYQTPLGMGLLVLGAGVSAIAYRIMGRLGTLPQEKRWFA